MKILLDHNIDRRFKRYFPDHEISTAQENGWSDVLNGALLAFAENDGFEVMITADSNIRSQQNMSNRSVAIIVLRALNKLLKTHAVLVEAIDSALLAINEGELIEVYHPDFPRT